jgi:hypothetical protein
VAATGAALALSAAPAANADIFAVVDVPVPTLVNPGVSTERSDQFDIAFLNATTGVRLTGPVGINTSAEELHPSITPDGRWLAFERVDLAAGTRRIILVDLSSGQQADLFSAFEAQQEEPAAPFVLPDGSEVITGGVFVRESDGLLHARWTRTSLANFPGGPFDHVAAFSQFHFDTNGRTVDSIDRPSSAFAGTAVFDSSKSKVIEEGVRHLVDTGFGFSFGAGHPALSDPTTDVVVFEGREVAGGLISAQLLFEPDSDGFGTVAPTKLPALVNATSAVSTSTSPAFDEAFPAFTSDGRYLGFVRHSFQDSRDRLFIFDIVTQTLLNTQGIDLGEVSSPASSQDRLRRLEGNLSLREQPVFSITRVSSLGTLSFGLLQPSGVGILVQRIVGHHRLFGHGVPTLKTIGRVPFGQFGRGRHHVHWNVRVNGRRLPPGTYLITPRALTRHGIVRELGTPGILRVR